MEYIESDYNNCEAYIEYEATSSLLARSHLIMEYEEHYGEYIEHCEK